MKIIFVILVVLFLLPLQMLFRFSLGNISLNLEFSIILIIFIGFEFGLFEGLVSVAVLSLMLEASSAITPFSTLFVGCFVFVTIYLLMDQFYTEAYVTKALWVGFLTLFIKFLYGFVLYREVAHLDKVWFWEQLFVQSVINALIAIPSLLFLDRSLSFWLTKTSRKKAQITGADYFVSKSKQRRYL
ncbi:MAG TPA: hypothetical protein DDW49_09655 [Deltaproteobacteria bacterium]|nr:MAG: hypothetical protein A2048_10085 [Deltaproteobacteria bacterium GWA2_45_12]HBF13627.1 hypothetical protein [Deltaproteobacteria bacterium]